MKLKDYVIFEQDQDEDGFTNLTASLTFNCAVRIEPGEESNKELIDMAKDGLIKAIEDRTHEVMLEHIGETLKDRGEPCTGGRLLVYSLYETHHVEKKTPVLWIHPDAYAEYIKKDLVAWGPQG